LDAKWEDFSFKRQPKSFVIPNDEFLVVSGRVYFVEFKTGKTIRQLPFIPDRTCVSSDGKWLLASQLGTRSNIGLLHLVDLQTGKAVHTFDQFETHVATVFIHPTGNTAISSDAKAIYFLDLENKKVVEKIPNQKMGIGNAVDADFRRLAMVGEKEVAIWDIEKRCVLDRFMHGDDVRPNELAFSPDGQSLLLAGTRTWPVHFRPALKILPSEERLENRAIVIYDLKKGNLIRTIAYPTRRSFYSLSPVEPSH
jgi:WD40 repeat protein